MYFLIHHNIFFYKRYLVAVGGEKLSNKQTDILKMKIKSK